MPEHMQECGCEMLVVATLHLHRWSIVIAGGKDGFVNNDNSGVRLFWVVYLLCKVG